MTSTIRQVIEEQGWNDSSVLDILWEYLHNQDSMDALEEHFKLKQIDEETQSMPSDLEDEVEMVTLRFTPQLRKGGNNEYLINVRAPGEDTFKVPEADYLETRGINDLRHHSNALEWMAEWMGPFKIEKVS